MAERYDDLVVRLDSVFTSKGTTASRLAFRGKIGNGGALVILSLLPFENEAKEGVKFQAYTKRLAEYRGISWNIDRACGISVTGISRRMDLLGCRE